MLLWMRVFRRYGQMVAGRVRVMINISSVLHDNENAT